MSKPTEDPPERDLDDVIRAGRTVMADREPIRSRPSK